MSDPILILTGPEEGPYLIAKLRAAKAGGIIETVTDAQSLDKTAAEARFGQAPSARLLAFCTNVVVPARILDLFKGGAYNFHPGPPDYPGSHAASFAIYDQVSHYGVTAHEMAVEVDSGAIVGVETFPVPPEARFVDLEMLAYQNLLNLFDRLAPQLVNTTQPLPALPLQWGANKRTRAEFERMKTVTADMSEAEIRLRWRAFG